VGGGDTYRTVVHGTRADIGLEQGAHTGHRRRVFVQPRVEPADVLRSVERVAAEWQEAKGQLVLERDGVGIAITMAPGADGGHETHFARVRDELLLAIDEHRFPGARMRRTRAKYALLAAAARATTDCDSAKP
jgi:hypothetical protein